AVDQERGPQCARGPGDLPGPDYRGQPRGDRWRGHAVSQKADGAIPDPRRRHRDAGVGDRLRGSLRRYRSNYLRPDRGTRHRRHWRPHVCPGIPGGPGTAAEVDRGPWPRRVSGRWAMAVRAAATAARRTTRPERVSAATLVSR